MVVARALNSKMKGQTFFRAWFFFPAVLSGLTVSLIFKQFFNYGLPTIGKILGISFLQESLLGTPIGAVVATIFCSSMARSSNANYSLSCWSSEYSI